MSRGLRVADLEDRSDPVPRMKRKCPWPASAGQMGRAGPLIPTVFVFGFLHDQMPLQSLRTAIIQTNGYHRARGRNSCSGKRGKAVSVQILTEPLPCHAVFVSRTWKIALIPVPA
jgi:hypothetical protein